MKYAQEFSLVYGASLAAAVGGLIGVLLVDLTVPDQGTMNKEEVACLQEYIDLHSYKVGFSSEPE